MNILGIETFGFDNLNRVLSLESPLKKNAFAGEASLFW